MSYDEYLTDEYRRQRDELRVSCRILEARIENALSLVRRYGGGNRHGTPLALIRDELLER